MKNSLIFGTTMITGFSIGIVIVALFVAKDKRIKKYGYLYLFSRDSKPEFESGTETGTETGTESGPESGPDSGSNDSQDVSNGECKYENKYIKEYNDLSGQDLNVESRDESDTYPFIEETTPYGIIKMSYNSLSECFIYYTNKNEMPYKYLETVGRLYVIKHDCKNIYINYEKELDCAIEKYSNKLKTDNIDASNSSITENTEDKSYNIFAKFRISTVTREASNKNKDNKWIIPKKTNKYIFKGKLRNFDEDYPIAEVCGTPENSEKNIDYQSFIKRMGLI